MKHTQLYILYQSTYNTIWKISDMHENDEVYVCVEAADTIAAA